MTYHYWDEIEKIARTGKRFVEGIATTVIGTKTYQCKEGRDMNIKQKMKYKAKREVKKYCVLIVIYI